MNRRAYALRCYLAGFAVAGVTYLLADALGMWIAGGIA